MATLKNNVAIRRIRKSKMFAKFYDDADAFVLHIELADDRSIMLAYPKPNGNDSGWPSVTLSTGTCDCEFAAAPTLEITYDEFEDWAKIATGVMRPERERRWLCQICGDKQGFGPMLPDQVWNAIAPNPRGMMCLDCMRVRAITCFGRNLADVC
jgi:hypothetical protein